MPLVGGDVEPALDGGAAQRPQLVAEGVAGHPLLLGHGEGDEAPLPVPPPAGGVLAVGQPGALHDGAQGGHAVGGELEAGVPAGAAVAEQQPFGHEPAQTRPHLLGALAAGLGHGVELGGRDRPVLADHPEDQRPGRDLNGRIRHDRDPDDRLLRCQAARASRKRSVSRRRAADYSACFRPLD